MTDLIEKLSEIVGASQVQRQCRRVVYWRRCKTLWLSGICCFHWTSARAVPVR